MRWRPPIESERERVVAARLRASSRFYRFLWEIRRELFEDGFEETLIQSYQPRGQDPCPPAMLAMVLLLQRYEGLSDAGSWCWEPLVARRRHSVRAAWCVFGCG